MATRGEKSRDQKRTKPQASTVPSVDASRASASEPEGASEGVVPRAADAAESDGSETLEAGVGADSGGEAAAGIEVDAETGESVTAVEVAEGPTPTDSAGESDARSNDPEVEDADEPVVFDLDADLADLEHGTPAAPDASANDDRPEPVSPVVGYEARERPDAPSALTDNGSSSDEEEREPESLDAEHDLDLAGAFDLGPGSTPEERERLLAEAFAHAEMQDARYRVPIPKRRVARIKGGIALGLLTLAGVLAVTPPALVRPTPAAAVQAADRREGVAAALLLQAAQIEAFRTRELRLPASLDEVAIRLDGVRYVRSNNRLYQLVAYTPQGEAVVYDSSAPSPEFARLEARWLGHDGS